MKKICLFVCSFALVGCVQHPLSVPDMPDARPLGASLKTLQPKEQAPSMTQVDGEITLTKAMAAALLRSPDLAVFAWEMRAAEARLLQAGLWSNPQVKIEIEDFGGSGELSGSESLETTISLSQSLPLGGDIIRQRESAGFAAQLVGWDYEAARLEVLTDTTERFIEVLASQRRVALAKETLDLAQQVSDGIGKRVAGGASPEVELLRAKAPVAAARVALRRAGRALEAARIQLALSWAENNPAFDKVVGNFEEVSAAPNPAALIALLNQNPQVARWAVQISKRQADLKLAQAQATPDLTVELGLRHANASDDQAVVLGFEIDLPIFNRNQGAIQEARIGVAAAAYERHAAQLRVAAAITDAYKSLAGAYDQITGLRDDALPIAQDAFDATHHAFDLGELGFLDVIDSERSLIELRSQYIEALSEYHIATARLEGLIGRSLKNINSKETP